MAMRRQLTLLCALLVIIVTAVNLLGSFHFLSLMLGKKFAEKFATDTFTKSRADIAFSRVTVMKFHSTVSSTRSPENPTPPKTVVREKVDPKQNKTTKVTLTVRTVRPMRCQDCFKHNFNYVIRNEAVCRQSKGDVIDLLLLITTVHDHVTARQALRDTWLSVARGNRGNVRYVFLLGENFNSTTRKALFEENRKYGDLLMEDFKDSYRNLTLKTVMGITWAVTSCPSARYVMKTDDDMWVNVKSILRLTKVHAKEFQSKVGGSCRGRGFPLRKKNSKWYTSVESYPQDSFPAYCSGTGYVTSMDVIRKVKAVSPSVPFFYLEDIYVGLCLKPLKLGVLKLPGFFHRRSSQAPCFLQSASVVTSHQVEPQSLMAAWNAKCANSTI